MTFAKLTRPGQLRWHSVRRPLGAEDSPEARATRLFQALNERHFGGTLPDVPIRLSGRMKKRLGQISLDRATGRPYQIVLGRMHVERDGWDVAAQTLLHEMVHLWQWQEGLPVDHGRGFRDKAREVGVTPRARRREADVAGGRKPAYQSPIPNPQSPPS